MKNLSSQHHSFDIHIAQEYGMKEAIIIHHFQHWIGVNQRKSNGKKTSFRDGKWWTYQTLDDIAAHFPYLSKSEIFDIIEKLCTGKGRRSKKGQQFEPVLVKGNYNKIKFDKTIWYSFANEEKFTVLAQAKMENGSSQHPDRLEPTPIPDTKTDTKKDNLKRDNVSPQREKKKTFKLSLSPEQRNAFDKVMSHPFKWCDKPKENDVCAWMLSMKISPERIISALKLLTQDTRDAERTHRKIDNEVGSLLTIARSKQERVLRNDDFEFNKAHASRSSKINRFLKLTRDYVTIAVGHATENLMFNLPKGTFITTLDCYIRQAKAQEA